MLTLSKALKTGKLRQFIAQEEKRGLGPADRAALDALIERMAKPRRSEDQTSRSASGDGSNEK